MMDKPRGAVPIDEADADADGDDENVKSDEAEPDTALPAKTKPEGSMIGACEGGGQGRDTSYNHTQTYRYNKPKVQQLTLKEACIHIFTHIPQYAGPT